MTAGTLALHGISRRFGSVQALAPLVQAQARAPWVGGHKLSVCVLPFANMSGDPEQEFFADGLTEDIYWHQGRSPAYGEGITGLVEDGSSAGLAVTCDALRAGENVRGRGLRRLHHGVEFLARLAPHADRQQ